MVKVELQNLILSILNDPVVSSFVNSANSPEFRKSSDGCETVLRPFIAIYKIDRGHVSQLFYRLKEFRSLHFEKRWAFPIAMASIVSLFIFATCFQSGHHIFLIQKSIRCFHCSILAPLQIKPPWILLKKTSNPHLHLPHLFLVWLIAGSSL